MKGFGPFQDRVLVRRVPAEEKTAGGLIILDTAKEKTVEGEVSDPIHVMKMAE
jgi:chaperonin GroES